MSGDKPRDPADPALKTIEAVFDLEDGVADLSFSWGHTASTMSVGRALRGHDGPVRKTAAAPPARNPQRASEKRKDDGHLRQATAAGAPTPGIRVANP